VQSEKRAPALSIYLTQDVARSCPLCGEFKLSVADTPTQIPGPTALQAGAVLIELYGFAVGMVSHLAMLLYVRCLLFFLDLGSGDSRSRYLLLISWGVVDRLHPLEF